MSKKTRKELIDAIADLLIEFSGAGFIAAYIALLGGSWLDLINRLLFAILCIYVRIYIRRKL